MAHKPASSAAQKALKASDYSQSKSTPTVWTHKETGKQVSSDNNHIRKQGCTGWINISNKKKV